MILTAPSGTAEDHRPKLRPAALPRHGQVMVRSTQFPNVLYPALSMPRLARGEAIRTGRVAV